MLKLTYQDNQTFVWRTGSLSRFFNDKNNEMLTQEELKNLKVGDTLLYGKTGRELETLTVSKIGNKYFYCNPYNNYKFDIETGKEISNYVGGELWRNAQSYNEHIERLDLLLDLSRYSSTRLLHLTNEQLKSIINQLNNQP